MSTRISNKTVFKEGSKSTSSLIFRSNKSWIFLNANNLIKGN